MRYKTGLDKHQPSLLPASLDDYVPENHICRVISAFTEQLDMALLGYKYAECKGKGCRPYDPRMMLNLYLYGYMHRVRSSRRLRDEAQRNVEVMWLMEGLTPDDKTISNFRKDNAKALRGTFRAFVTMFRELGLYGGEIVATDSTKYRANNSRKNNHNKITVQRELSRLEKKISEYMNALDKADKEEEGEKMPGSNEIKKALEKLTERKIEFEKLFSQVEAGGEVSTKDTDSRLIHSGGDARPLDVGYNVQTVVDSKHDLIVDFDIIDRPDDKGSLYNMSKKAMEALGVETIINLADKGYYDGEDINSCEQQGVTCLVAKPKPGGMKKPNGFTINCFIYDKKTDCYICPNQNQLKFMRDYKHSNGKQYRVYANYPVCSKCSIKTECTKSRYRQILRLPYQDMLDKVDERTRKNKELYRRRQEIVEHPFGTIKAIWGFKQFLCRSKPKVTAETALAYMAYNLRRVINILAVNRLNIATKMA